MTTAFTAPCPRHLIETTARPFLPHPRHRNRPWGREPWPRGSARPWAALPAVNASWTVPRGAGAQGSNV